MAQPVFIVTGASRGIGRAIAKTLQSRGACVVAAARNFAGLEPTPNLYPVTADVSKDAGREALVEAALQRYGRLDGLVNNVGLAFRATATETRLENFREMLEVNVLAAFALARLAYPSLKSSRGTIVNISSVMSRRVLPNRIAYGTSKAALDHLTRSLAVEWGPDGIRVNAVLPWFTRTEMVAQVLKDRAFEERLIAMTPLRRLAESEDIARAAAFLALPESNFITGQVLAVDGGYLVQGL